MEVRLIGITEPYDGTTAEEFISYCARVSNPKNQENYKTSSKLLKYCIDHKHWSVFEMVNVVMELKTTRDITHQIIRHRSNSFQEFCVAGGTSITVERGTRTIGLPIAELYERYSSGKTLPRVKVFDRSSKTFTFAEIKEVFSTGKKEIYQLTLENGKTISSTKDHKFLTLGGDFKRLEDVSIENDFIATNGICNETVSFKKVKSIEYVGIEDTFDLEVEHDEHNYIANGIVTHNSQRYAAVSLDSFELREARLQDNKNRQNSLSLDADDPRIAQWEAFQQKVISTVVEAYQWAIDNGLAKEVARAVLPEGMTPSVLYMNGTLRSWINYIDVRNGPDTQKEHRDVALAIMPILENEFPFLKDYWNKNDAGVSNSMC